jgi:hypothetical protein
MSLGCVDDSSGLMIATGGEKEGMGPKLAFVSPMFCIPAAAETKKMEMKTAEAAFFIFPHNSLLATLPLALPEEQSVLQEEPLSGGTQ